MFRLNPGVLVGLFLVKKVGSGSVFSEKVVSGSVVGKRSNQNPD